MRRWLLWLSATLVVVAVLLTVVIEVREPSNDGTESCGLLITRHTDALLRKACEIQGAYSHRVRLVVALFVLAGLLGGLGMVGGVRRRPPTASDDDAG